jgi:hypothetical protein
MKPKDVSPKDMKPKDVKPKDVKDMKREDMGPTGPVRMPADRSEPSYDDKHPHPGNAGQDSPVTPPGRGKRESG